MARGDGIDRTNVRNMRLTVVKIMNTQRHNEREKDSYVNQDIVPEMSQYNVRFKRPSGSYAEMFEQMERDKIISTRGLKEDVFTFGELIFDVNSAYFYNHGSYEFAKQFYHDAYKSAREIISSRTSFAISFCLLYTLRYKLKQEAGALCITPNWKPFLLRQTQAASVRRQSGCSSRPRL